MLTCLTPANSTPPNTLGVINNGGALDVTTTPSLTPTNYTPSTAFGVVNGAPLWNHTTMESNSVSLTR